jgi:hypothetical protein
MNRKGQFSIIAALLVAVVLISAVMITYSAIRYSPVEKQPQILSSIDETNLGLKEILGFTVGYYGSVLKVTGNMTYAQQLATNYLKSGLNNMGDVQPEWGAVFELQKLTLNASWFATNSYSQGSLVVNYNLTGLGVYGASYNASARLDTKILTSASSNQAELVILRDDDEPLINLGKTNLQFYSYDYNTSSWNIAQPAGIASYANGTYVLDLPSGVDKDAYTIQISDNRGLMVLASSFTQFTTDLTWNATGFSFERDYVDSATVDIGMQGNFSAQQAAPDSVYDMLTEVVSGTFNTDYFPGSMTLLGSTTNISGSLLNLQTNNNQYLQLRSYATAFSSAYNTIGVDSQSGASLGSQASTLTWTHSTGLDGADKILLVSVDIFRSNNAPTTISSITCDGVALTQVATTSYDANPRVRSYVYYLTSPAVGTNNITVTFASTTLAVGGAITYTNVNQATPVLASNISSNSGTNPSVSLTTLDTNLKVLFGHLGTYRTSNPTAYNVNDGQTNRWSQTDNVYKGYGSDKTVTNGTVSTSWTPTNTVSWTAIAVLLQPTQVGTAFACSAEFSGTSNTDTWNNLLWAIDASATSAGANITYQLYNYATSSYTTIGDGYQTDILSTNDNTKTQTITTNWQNFRNSTSGWKLKINATQTSTTQFDLKLDLAKFSPNENNYAVAVEEQWLTVNASNVRQDLCIKTGNFSMAEPLVVQVFHGGSWVNLMTLAPNFFNNVTLIPYIDSTTLTIRFVGYNDLTDNASSSFDIDSVFIKDEPDVAYFIGRQQSTFTVEILQNGTMRWIGENMKVTTKTIPIPPIPVKAIHVNQTINGVNQQVPFQIEDWASSYQIPLGLTSNTTVFSNRQMIVVLLNSGVKDFTVWWDGNDTAVQTSYAYTNRYFTADNVASATLTNSNVTLLFSGGTVKATLPSGTYSTATFMRINAEASTYGAGCSYVIHHGIIRDIVQQEAEWNTGAANCPNLYANIIIVLPANSTYYTYNLRLMFINSTQTRTLSDLCPLKLVSSVTGGQTQTENGTQANWPLLQNGTATFPNYASPSWTAHHFAQYITGLGKGAGFMFGDVMNQRLYVFDSIAGHSTGALYANNATYQLELQPVALSTVSFTYAYDVTWKGAVATFDGTTPVCSLYDATTPNGLWILAEYPPSLTITPKS